MLYTYILICIQNNLIRYKTDILNERVLEHLLVIKNNTLLM